MPGAPFVASFDLLFEVAKAVPRPGNLRARSVEVFLLAKHFLLQRCCSPEVGSLQIDRANSASAMASERAKLPSLGESATRHLCKASIAESKQGEALQSGSLIEGMILIRFIRREAPSKIE